MDAILRHLFALQDPACRRREDYRLFQARILCVPADGIIGVRTPALRAYAKELEGTPAAERFLRRLPHRYHEEKQLHAYLIGQCRDFDTVIARLDAFLPHVDNWATCDSMNARVFRRRLPDLLPHLRAWLASPLPFTRRYAMEQLMCCALDAPAFRPEYLDWVAADRSEPYYVRMMVAWFFATALAKQWDAALPFLRDRRLPPWAHAKAIQKACESFRIPPARKACLRTLR